MRDWDFYMLFDRGMLEDAIVKEEVLKDIEDGKRLTIYQGFDPTSPNLHIGHLLSLRILRWFQLHGHRVIFLIGDFTGRIGDPSERPEMRQRLTHQQVLTNAATYREQITKILDLEGDNPAEVKFNAEWLDKMTLKDFIEVMDKFTVQQLLERSMFQNRLDREEALYLNEMMYPLLQGYDSVAMEVDVELGGSDQLFNMLRGRDLVRAYLNKTKHVLTTPLLPGLDGRKMSKTYGNTVDLTEDAVPMFFKLTLIQDSLLPVLMNALTNVPGDEIETINNRLETESNLIDARVRFALNLVSVMHGKKAANDAQAEFQRVVGEGELPSDIPVLQVPLDAISDEHIAITDLLRASDLVSSKSDARRLVEQGGIRINGKSLTDPLERLPLSRLASALIKIGRRGYVKVQLPES